MSAMAPPPFDRDEALTMVIAAGENAPSRMPREAGLRAVFAVMQLRHFGRPEESWTYYQSSRQRFYEWKQCIEAAMARHDDDDMSFHISDLLVAQMSQLLSSQC